MLFSTRLLNPCVVSAESSILSSSVPSRSSSSIKSILYHRFFKKRTPIIQHPEQRQQRSTRQLLCQKRSNRKSHTKTKTTNDYDMTILHEDELENAHLATVRRRKKTIPSWANKEQLQLAVINQTYFQNQNPEDIFGTIRIEDVHDIIKSIDNKNTTSISMISSRIVL